MAMKNTVIAKIRNNFFTGIITLLPLALTAYCIYWLAMKINGLVWSVTPRVYRSWLSDDHFGLWIRLLIFLIICILVTLIGRITKMYLGKKILAFGEKVFDTIPVLNKVYSVIKQVSVAVFGQDESFFKRVVMVQYPYAGVWVIGFQTAHSCRQISEKHKPLVNVFVPTTPNPTSGFLLMFPESEITALDLTIEEGMKLIVSGGAVQPQ